MKKKTSTVEDQIIELLVKNGYCCPSVMAQDLFRLSISLAMAAGIPNTLIKRLINQDLDLLISANKKPKKRVKK